MAPLLLTYQVSEVADTLVILGFYGAALLLHFGKQQLLAPGELLVRCLEDNGHFVGSHVSSLWSFDPPSGADKEVYGLYHKFTFSVKVREEDADKVGMGQWIHYEADIFFLMDSIHLLKRNLALEVDAAYFLDKVLQDLRFIDARLTGLHNSLKGNSYLLDRNKYIRYLYKAEKAFAALCISIVKGDTGSQIGLAAHSRIIDSMGKGQSDHAEELFGSTAITVNREEQLDQLSQEEFKYLFIQATET